MSKLPSGIGDKKQNKHFTYPGTDFILEDKPNFLYSQKYGKVFFKLNQIPILRTDNSLLMTVNDG